MSEALPKAAKNADPMTLALTEAGRAGARGEVPVGAVLVDSASGQVLAVSGNRVEELHDPTAHAELLVLRAAAAAGASKRLPLADLYVTLEPCPMCAQAIAFARLRRVYYGAYDPKGGGLDHGPHIFEQPTCHWRPQVTGGVLADESADLLRGFFRARRGKMP